MNRQLTWLRDVQSTIALGRQSVGGASQYLAMFPGAELGVMDPYLEEYLTATRTLRRDRAGDIREVEALAHRGSVLSMLFLADALRKGQGCELDLHASETWYRRAALFGSGRAMYGLGMINFSKNDIGSVVEDMEAGAERGCGAALWALGLLYKQGGEGFSRDVDKARAFLERGAALGHVWSSRTLAILLMSGRYGLRARLRGYVTYLACFLAAPMAICGGSVDRIMR